MYLVSDFFIFHLNFMILDIRQDNSDGEDEVSNDANKMISITADSINY